ncbi:MAG: hypothetical protein R2850_10760 [Bacteroidia bacterium]
MNESGNYQLTIPINGCTSPPTTTQVLVVDASFLPPIATNSPIFVKEKWQLSTPSVTSAQCFWTGPNGTIGTAMWSFGPVSEK